MAVKPPGRDWTVVREVVRRVRMRGRDWNEEFSSVVEKERGGGMEIHLGKPHREDWLAASS